MLSNPDNTNPILNKTPQMVISTPEALAPQEKRNLNNPLYNSGNLSYPLALKSSKSAQSRDDLHENKSKDRNTRHKSDSLINTVTVTSTSTNIDTSLYCTKKQQVVIPVYQPFVKVDKKLPTKIENQILDVQKILRSYAEEGNLMIENRELVDIIMDKCKLADTPEKGTSAMNKTAPSISLVDKAKQLINKCEKEGVVHTTHRQFGNKKQIFHSLNLDLISHESILWVLRSLKRDEMTPNEKAIQSRIKEAF